MTRIFLYLAGFALAMTLLALGLGLNVGDLSADPYDEAARARFRMHFLGGVSAALVVVLVNSIVVTYFIGTGRWCKEVAQAYRLNPSFIARSTQLKRRTFPWALMGMLTIVGVIALGAASDPTTGIQNTAMWSTVHFCAALAGLALIGWAFVIEWTNIAANQQLIGDVMAEVARIRAERGLAARAE